MKGWRRSVGLALMVGVAGAPGRAERAVAIAADVARGEAHPADAGHAVRGRVGGCSREPLVEAAGKVPVHGRQPLELGAQPFDVRRRRGFRTVTKRGKVGPERSDLVEKSAGSGAGFRRVARCDVDRALGQSGRARETHRERQA